jgi:hypothetical protein
MTSGSKFEIVSSPRSVGVFHGVWACSVVFLVMRWMKIEKIPRVTTLWGQLCFADKSSMNSDGTGPYTRVYATGCVWASVVMPYHCRVMSAPIPEATVLAMLIQRIKSP